MKTEAEVTQLKVEWASDPCWDIEDTEGFEEYHDELLAYRIQMEQHWRREIELQEIRQSKKLNCSVELVR